jgi:hypothetical protein
MPTIKPIGIEIFNEYSSAIIKCRKEMTAQEWFSGNWWINFSFNGGGFIFQLSKTSWHNQNGKGIHFEFWIDAQEHQDKTVPIVLHFEPDTPNRKVLGAKFKVAFAELEDGFLDYKINHGAICDKMQKYEKFTKNGLHKLIVREFTRLQRVGPIIDEILS